MFSSLVVKGKITCQSKPAARQIERGKDHPQSKVGEVCHREKRVVGVFLEIAQFDFDRVFGLLEIGTILCLRGSVILRDRGTRAGFLSGSFRNTS